MTWIAPEAVALQGTYRWVGFSLRRKRARNLGKEGFVGLGCTPLWGK